MPPIILSGGIALDPNDVLAQQLQAHAEHLNLDDVQVVRAIVVGHPHTYLVLDRLRPVFKHAAPDAVIAHLEGMANKRAQEQEQIPIFMLDS